MAKAIESGLPKMRIEEAAARTQAFVLTQIPRLTAGVNKHVSICYPIDILEVDNTAVQTQQVERLQEPSC